MSNMNNNINSMNDNNMNIIIYEKWAVNAMCKKMSPNSYQFNITWPNVIIVEEYPSGFISL